MFSVNEKKNNLTDFKVVLNFYYLNFSVKIWKNLIKLNNPQKMTSNNK